MSKRNLSWVAAGVVVAVAASVVATFARRASSCEGPADAAAEVRRDAQTRQPSVPQPAMRFLG